MNETIEKKSALKALERIREYLWEIDIPSPTVPEYIEHHEQIKGAMELVDKEIKAIRDAKESVWIPVKFRPLTEGGDSE